MVKRMEKYIALVGCENAKKRFEPGEVVNSKDFSAAVIKNWLEIGVLEIAPALVTPEPVEEALDGDWKE